MGREDHLVHIWTAMKKPVRAKILNFVGLVRDCENHDCQTQTPPLGNLAVSKLVAMVMLEGISQGRANHGR